MYYLLCFLVIIGEKGAFGDVMKFPDDFIFGTATAAYQIEGGWNVDGKGLSIWDNFTHSHADTILDHSNGDIAADSYHLFDEDLKALQSVGVQFHRFSISWPRILPNGDLSVINQKGVSYYNEVIDKLIANNIEPMITMYHWDLPQNLQNQFGGWINSSIIEHFRNYAELLFQRFGDRVKYWITFNEPYVYCPEGYGRATTPPLVHQNGIGEYLCVDNTIKSHATVYHLYREKYFAEQRGKVGITLSSHHYYTKDKDSQELAERGIQFKLGWPANPIFHKNGGYPQVMIDRIAENSKKEGLTESRLPDMTEEWRQKIQGSADFLGLNYYTSRYVEEATQPVGENPSNVHDCNLEFSVDPTWKVANNGWLFSVPLGLRDNLKWIKDHYDNIEVIITENGWSDVGILEDNDRIDYIRDHLAAVYDAITHDKCNVTGYAVWSIIDDYEWGKGYTDKLGLYYVNFTSPKRERTPKLSAKFYESVIKARGLDNSQCRTTPGNLLSLLITASVLTIFARISFYLS